MIETITDRDFRATETPVGYLASVPIVDPATALSMGGGGFATGVVELERREKSAAMTANAVRAQPE